MEEDGRIGAPCCALLRRYSEDEGSSGISVKECIFYVYRSIHRRINILGEQIARYRKALGMTQEDLGRAVGISAQAVSRWECGGAPDVTLLPAVADALGS